MKEGESLKKKIWTIWGVIMAFSFLGWLMFGIYANRIHVLGFWLGGTMTLLFEAPFLLLMIMLLTPYFEQMSAKKKAIAFSASAVVFSKTQNNTRFGSTYYIAFTLQDGNRKNIMVPIEKYSTIKENECGILTYKEYGKYIEFVDFQVNS